MTEELTELEANMGELLSVSLDNGAIERITDLAQKASADVLADPLAEHVRAVRRVLSDGSQIEQVDLEPYQPNPRRRKGTIRVATPDALVALALRQTTPGTVTYVDVPPGATREGAITTVANDHEDAAGEPGWRDHRVTYPFTPTPEWEAWLRADNCLGSQADFAEMIEDLRDTIVSPDAATLLEIVQTFHANTDVKFSSAVRINSGEVKLTYDETITTTAGKGRDLAVPSEFTVQTPTFMGGPSALLTARLRYRVSGGSLAIGFKLLSPHLAWAAACDSAAATVREALESTSLVVDGSPG